MSLKIGSASTEPPVHEKIRRLPSSRQFGTMIVVVSLSPGPGDRVMGEADGEAGGETLTEENLGDSEASKPCLPKSGMRLFFCEGVSGFQ